MSDPAEDGPFDPRRWSARVAEGGPITGDEYAYLKDLIHERLGVGKVPPQPAALPRRRWRVLFGQLHKKRG